MASQNLLNLQGATKDPRYEPRHGTIVDLLRRVFPDGTNREYAGKTPEQLAELDLLRDAPKWAPDLFAAMALLIEQSGCYTHPEFVQQYSIAMEKDVRQKRAGMEAESEEQRVPIAKGYSNCWQTHAQSCSVRQENQPSCNRRTPESCGWQDGYDDKIQAEWQALLSHGRHEIGSPDDLRGEKAPEWCVHAMILFAIADEACGGVGFGDKLDPAHSNRIAHHVYENQRLAYKIEHESRKDRVQNIQWIEGDFKKVTGLLTEGVAGLEAKIKSGQFMKLPYLPHSICFAVPSYISCVQPKANTPQLGYSLRSFSHNLALVPRVGEVSTQWFNAFAGEDNTHNPLNLLLIPYPYCVTATNFGGVPEEINKFSVRQEWLMDLLTPAEKDQIARLREEQANSSLDIYNYTDRSEWKLAELQADEIFAGISKLILSARKNITTVHGVILPELSLSFEVAEIASRLLFENFKKLEFFISGVLAPRQVKSPNPRPINSVFTRLKMSWPNTVRGGTADIPLRRIQVKHHRWKLDKDQIIRYHLGDRLDPELKWWEDNDMIERESLFWVFRPNMVMTSLVCEDLARIDPVQPVLRAVAPNLVIALLLDGPQCPTRWASRYASALSDDPGCGVLTLTSLGMIRRDSHSAHGDNHIAMWKDSEGRSQFLTLPKGAAALTVTLSTKQVDEIAAGGRKKETPSRKLYLSANHPVPTPRGHVMFAGLDDLD